MSTEQPRQPLIGNEDEIRRFHALHIAPANVTNPESRRPNRTFVLLPLARKKYHRELSQESVTLPPRNVYASISANNLVRRIRAHEVKEGVYVDDAENDIPPEAIGIYMSVNLCDEVRAYVSMQEVLNKRMLKMTRSAEDVTFCVENVYRSALHKSASKLMRKFDIDTKDASCVELLCAFLWIHSIVPHLVVETHNGYHMVINNAKGFAPGDKGAQARNELNRFVAKRRAWIREEDSAAQIVVPGTYHGGFLARIVDGWGTDKYTP